MKYCSLIFSGLEVLEAYKRTGVVLLPSYLFITVTVQVQAALSIRETWMVGCTLANNHHCVFIERLIQSSVRIGRRGGAALAELDTTVDAR